MSTTSQPLLRRLKSAASTAVHTIVDRRYREFSRHRRMRDLTAREEAADKIARGLPRSAGVSDAPYQRESEQLQRDGYTFLPDLVSSQQIRDVLAHCENLPAHDPYRPELGTFTAPENVPPVTHVAHYSNEAILDAPHLLSIANDPRVLTIVERFLGAKPTIGALRLWWSTPTPSGEPEHAELFHRDIDDLRFVKLFVYLTDVDDESGPHIYASGSHRKNTLTQVGRFTDKEVADAVGEETIVRLKGPAGTSFIESTYGLHRGLPPTRKPRLVFQPLYTLRPVIFGPRRPIRRRSALDGAVDRYVNRVFLSD